MLKCFEKDGEDYLFLSFFAVGDYSRALICHVVKGGGRALPTSILEEYFHFSRFKGLIF
jgi:hypothetical protein